MHQSSADKYEMRKDMRDMFLAVLTWMSCVATIPLAVIAITDNSTACGAMSALAVGLAILGHCLTQRNKLDEPLISHSMKLEAWTVMRAALSMGCVMCLIASFYGGGREASLLGGGLLALAIASHFFYMKKLPVCSEIKNLEAIYSMPTKDRETS